MLIRGQGPFFYGRSLGYDIIFPIKGNLPSVVLKRTVIKFLSAGSDGG